MNFTKTVVINEGACETKVKGDIIYKLTCEFSNDITVVTGAYSTVTVNGELPQKQIFDLCKGIDRIVGVHHA